VGQSHPVADVVDEWTSFAGFEHSGLMERFAREGYQHTWCIANRANEMIRQHGWEVFVDFVDGHHVQYKIEHQPAVGGYLILLRRHHP
jgi:hypothetical protein